MQHIPVTQWPGDPALVWEHTSTGLVSDLERPRDVPRPESVEEIARWEDPDCFGRTELYCVPIFWVFLPVAALVYLIWGTVTDPGDGWTTSIRARPGRGMKGRPASRNPGGCDRM